jgi:hypothetical protein
MDTDDKQNSAPLPGRVANVREPYVPPEPPDPNKLPLLPYFERFPHLKPPSEMAPDTAAATNGERMMADNRRTDNNFMAGSGFARTFIDAPPDAPSEPPPKQTRTVIVKAGREGTTLTQSVEEPVRARVRGRRGAAHAE